VITDLAGTVFTRTAATKTVAAIGTHTKVVLELLLHYSCDRQTAEGIRFVATVGESELVVSTGFSLKAVHKAIQRLKAWSWIREHHKGKYEVGYQSAGGGAVFYADEAYSTLEQRLKGIESVDEKVKIAKEWIKEIEEANNARRI